MRAVRVISFLLVVGIVLSWTARWTFSVVGLALWAMRGELEAIRWQVAGVLPGFRLPDLGVADFLGPVGAWAGALPGLVLLGLCWVTVNVVVSASVARLRRAAGL